MSSESGPLPSVSDEADRPVSEADTRLTLHAASEESPAVMRPLKSMYFQGLGVVHSAMTDW